MAKPIEALRRVLGSGPCVISICKNANPAAAEVCVTCNARLALAEVEAVVSAAELVRYLMDEGEEQMKTAVWTTSWNDGTKALRAVLVPFGKEGL